MYSSVRYAEIIYFLTACYAEVFPFEKHVFATNDKRIEKLFGWEKKREKEKRKEGSEQASKKELKIDDKNRYLWQPN